MRASEKVVLICTGLYTPGGIERAIVNLANLFCTNGIVITILILDKTNLSFYPIHPQVKIVQKNLHFGIIETGNVFTRKVQFITHIKKLGRILKSLNPGIIIGTEYSLTIAAFLANSNNAKLISWEHHHFFWIKKNRFWTFLFNRIYPKLDTIVCLNKTEADLYSKIGCKTNVIPNFTIPQQATSSLEEKNLLTIGWLIKRKGMDLIPEIAEKIKEKHPDWHWQIIGDGALSVALQKEISKRKIEDFLKIVPPLSSNLSSHYLQTSIYVMTSRFECFPMVLLEAMSFGIPCIAFNCPTGPADIIESIVDGILIENEDVTSMADAICNLIENAEKRKKMGENAYSNVSRFSPEKILEDWQKLFEGF